MPRKAKPIGPVLQIDDMVIHRNEDLYERCGHVTGFGPDPSRWVRVMTYEGHYRVWARENLEILDLE